MEELNKGTDLQRVRAMVATRLRGLQRMFPASVLPCPFNLGCACVVQTQDEDEMKRALFEKRLAESDRERRASLAAAEAEERAEPEASEDVPEPTALDADDAEAEEEEIPAAADPEVVAEGEDVN